MSKVDCSKVCVRTSTFSDMTKPFNGAFAKIDIKKGISLVYQNYLSTENLRK